MKVNVSACIASRGSMGASSTRFDLIETTMGDGIQSQGPIDVGSFLLRRMIAVAGFFQMSKDLNIYLSFIPVGVVCTIKPEVKHFTLSIVEQGLGNYLYPVVIDIPIYASNSSDLMFSMVEFSEEYRE